MIIISSGIMFLMNYSVLSMFMQEKTKSILISLLLIMFVFLTIILANTFNNTVLSFLKTFINFYIGTVFIFFVLSIIFRLTNLIFKIDSKYLAIAFLVVGIFMVILATFNSIGFENHNYTIKSDKLDKDYKIVHISDIHIGSNSENHLKNIVKYINNLSNTDAVFITGDLVDENIDFEDLKSLNDLQTKTYFIYGNHDFFVNQKKFDNILSKLNLIVLRDESVNLEKLQIIGLNDNSNLKKELSKIEIQKDKFSILLNHQPSYIDYVKSKRINLMLSGHTHAGQIWPFNYLVRLQFKYIEGFYKFGNFHLNVNPGTGTWGPKMRLGSKNEIDIIHLKSTN